MKTKTFEELIVWQEAHQLALMAYRLTKTYPKEELFGLVSQFRRSAVSVAANIAEGYKKKGILDKLRFMNISQGSLEECRYYAILSQDLGYISGTQKGELKGLIERVSYLLNSYCTAIKSGIRPSSGVSLSSGVSPSSNSV